MRFEPYVEQFESFIFQFDDVLYPEKDYLLQVYYMFAQFIEYAEQKDATEILDYMKLTFAEEGKEGVFERTALRFGLADKYEINFNLLMQSIKLPLKLLIFDEMLRFLKAINEAGKQTFLLVSGDAITQLNKIKQTEWDGLSNSLRVYFQKELEGNAIESHVLQILNKQGLNPNKALLIGHLGQEISTSELNGIRYLDAKKLLF
jgi:hypothetical protein